MKKIDKHVRLALKLGNPEVTIDLYEYNNERPGKYNVFQEIAAQFLARKVADAVTAIDECRYDTIVHLVIAISVNNLLYQIESKCPPETLIPNA